MARLVWCVARKVPRRVVQPRANGARELPNSILVAHRPTIAGAGPARHVRRVLSRRHASLVSEEQPCVL